MDASRSSLQQSPHLTRQFNMVTGHLCKRSVLSSPGPDFHRSLNAREPNTLVPTREWLARLHQISGPRTGVARRGARGAAPRVSAATVAQFGTTTSRRTPSEGSVSADSGNINECNETALSAGTGCRCVIGAASRCISIAVALRIRSRSCELLAEPTEL